MALTLMSGYKDTILDILVHYFPILHISPQLSSSAHFLCMEMNEHLDKITCTNKVTQCFKTVMK